MVLSICALCSAAFGWLAATLSARSFVLKLWCLGEVAGKGSYFFSKAVE